MLCKNCHNEETNNTTGLCWKCVSEMNKTTMKEKESFDSFFAGLPMKDEKNAVKLYERYIKDRDFIFQTIAEATKAERERNLNIIMDFQGEIEASNNSDIKTGLVGACIELRKRLQ